MFPSSVGAGEGLVVGLIVNKPARVAAIANLEPGALLTRCHVRLILQRTPWSNISLGGFQIESIDFLGAGVTHEQG
jgi:hypothetical protein